jgi:hypothetical protein
MFVARHTPIVVALAGLWAFFAAQRRFSGPADRFTGLLLGWGVLHVLMGRQGVYQHEWWWWPMTPGIVIAAGLILDEVLGRLERIQGINWRISTATIAILLALFALWNARTVLREFASPKAISSSEMSYTLKELGDQIRQHVPPNQAALLVESDQSLGLWFYADRAIKRHVWDMDSFQKRQQDGVVDLSFDAAGTWSGPIKAMIVPKLYLNHLVPPLAEHLEANYPKVDTGKFLVYDVTPARSPAN